MILFLKIYQVKRFLFIFLMFNLKNIGIKRGLKGLRGEFAIQESVIL